MGNLDHWDPLLLDTLAADRDVITVDLHGVGGSHLLAENIRGAQLRIYPDGGHGFLDQYPVKFGQHVRQFLGR